MWWRRPGERDQPAAGAARDRGSGSRRCGASTAWSCSVEPSGGHRGPRHRQRHAARELSRMPCPASGCGCSCWRVTSSWRLQPIQGLSVRNALLGTVTEISPEEPAAVLVRVDVGGAVVLARITESARQALRLRTGDAVWALAKAVSTRGHAFHARLRIRDRLLAHHREHVVVRYRLAVLVGDGGVPAHLAVAGARSAATSPCR